MDSAHQNLESGLNDRDNLTEPQNHPDTNPSAAPVHRKSLDRNVVGMMPQAIEVMLQNPPVLPNESREEFLGIYDDIFDALGPQTTAEHWWVWTATTLTFEVLRYRRMKVAFMLNQRRAAVGGLIRQTFEIPAMREVRKPGSNVEANIERYFAEPDYAAKLARALDKSGFSIDAVESAVFTRSVSFLSQIERLITGAEKRLTLLFREMDRIRDARASRAGNIPTNILAG